MSLVQGTIMYAAELTWNGQRGVEGEYQRVINRMARSALGTFRSTPLEILAAESGHAPARALLDYRQSRLAQRLSARPRDGGGPEEILEREDESVVQRLRAASNTKPGETVEAQVWSEDRRFPGECSIDSGSRPVWRRGGAGERAAPV